MALGTILIRKYLIRHSVDIDTYIEPCALNAGFQIQRGAARQGLTGGQTNQLGADDAGAVTVSQSTHHLEEIEERHSR